MLTSLKIKNIYSIEESWNELTQAGFEPLYSIEEVEDNIKEIYINTPSAESLSQLLKQCKTIALIGLTIANETNWEEQWALHAPNYEEGYLKINLADFEGEGIIKLRAGGGFGDLSHSTTNQMLKLMMHNLKNKEVIDVGGVGVVSYLYALCKWELNLLLELILID